MNSELVDFLNNIGMGNGIAIIFGIGTLGFGIYKSIYSYLKKRDKDITNETIEELQDENELIEIKDSITKLTKDIDTLGGSITKFNNEMSEEFKNINKSVKELRSDVNILKDNTSSNNKKISLLLEGDSESIKLYIMDEFERYVQNGDKLDMAKLEYIENLYNTYLKENDIEDDKFLTKLIEEIRRVPLK